MYTPVTSFQEAACALGSSGELHCRPDVPLAHTCGVMPNVSYSALRSYVEFVKGDCHASTSCKVLGSFLVTNYLYCILKRKEQVRLSSTLLILHEDRNTLSILWSAGTESCSRCVFALRVSARGLIPCRLMRNGVPTPTACRPQIWPNGGCGSQVTGLPK